MQPLTRKCHDQVDGAFVIGINAYDGEVNRFGYGALMATVNANNGERMISDASWKCIVLEGHQENDPPAGWSDIDFDDSAWPSATEYGRNDLGTTHWAQHIPVPSDSSGGHVKPGISDDAQWIWTDDHEQHNDLFCRGTMRTEAGARIIESRATIDNAAYDILSLNYFTEMLVNNNMHDGNLESVGGDCDGTCATCTGTANRNNDNRCPSPQHDEVIASQLSAVCGTSTWKIYGKDRSIPATDLRHIRVAYSMDGATWTCYTQSNTPTQGGTPSLATASADCNEGPSHAASGSVFSINAPAKFVSMAFWGHTEIWEIALNSCDGQAPGRGTTSCFNLVQGHACEGAIVQVGLCCNSPLIVL